MKPFKSVIERYCPIVSGNVPVEVSINEAGTRQEECLNMHRLDGGCKTCECFGTKKDELTNSEN